MPFIPTPNGVKVCMKFTKSGQQCCNVFHVDSGGAATVADLILIASIFKDKWSTHLGAFTSADTALSDIEVTDISEEGKPGIVYTAGLPATGNPVMGALPNNVTVATKLLTASTGRSYRGRFYMVGTPSGKLTGDSQHITADLVAALEAFVEDVAATLITEGFKLAILSLVHNKAPRLEGVLTEVLGSTVNLTLDSQRRRLPERGS
jgi:hypothetical protein